MKSISKKILGLLICSSIILSTFSISVSAAVPKTEAANTVVVYSDMLDMNAVFDSSPLAVVTYSGSYYEQLSSDEQEMYSKFKEIFKDGDPQKGSTSDSKYELGISRTVNVSIDNYVTEIKSKLGDFSTEATKALTALLYDQPELTWLDGREIRVSGKYMIPTGTGNADVDIELSLVLSPGVVSEVTPAEMNGLIASAKSAIESARVSTSDYDTLEAIHDYLCNNIAYNHDAVKSDTSYTSQQTFAYQTAYSAFAKCNGDSVINTVCAGYAKSFKILCDSFGITCAVITGTGVSDSGSEPHAWNAVELDGKWYAVDCTWDDQTEPETAKKIFKDFFLVGSESVPENFYKGKFGDTHINNTDFVYPELNATAYVKNVEITPAAPTNVVAVAGDSKVDLTWDAVDNAESYSVYKDGVLVESGINDTKYTVDGLTNGTKYTFTVTATADKESEKSAEVTATPVKAEITPTAPTNVVAVAGDSKVDLTWDAVDKAESYSVYKDGVLVESGINDTKYTVDGLTNGTKYTFTVTATADKESEKSAEVTATPVNTEITPAAPTNVVAVAGDSKVDLTWDAVDKAESYSVYKDGVLVESGINDTKYTVDGLTNGTKYTFTVTATADKESEKSAEVTTTPVKSEKTLPVPTGLTAKAGDESAELTWNAVEGASSYSVYQDGKLVKSGITDTKYTVTNLKNGASYKFSVSADAVDANSTQSISVSARPFHTHTWSDTYEYSSTQHWKTCDKCDEESEKSTHRFSGWTIIIEATKSTTGLRKRTCSVCGYDQEEVIPKKTSSGGSSSRNDMTTKTDPLPAIGGTAKTWDNIASDIKAAPAGKNIVINANGSAKLPANVVAAIKESGAKVELVIDSTKSWIIDGSALTSASAIDLTTMAGTADASALRGAVGAKIRTAAANPGAFLKLALKYEYAGQFANLYKVENGKNVFVGCVKVDSFGTAVVPGITAAGEYIVMVGRYSDLRGDSNNDGVMNVMDVSDILKNITGISESANIQMADFNGDGVVNALDCSAILKIIVSK